MPVLTINISSPQNRDSSLEKEHHIDGHSKKTKRRKESADSEHSDKAKKCKKKAKKSKERSDESRRKDESRKSDESRRASPAPQTPTEPSASDSEEDFSLCAAPWCREPEGDEVCPISHATTYISCIDFVKKTKNKQLPIFHGILLEDEC